jgi:hypothetical protein
MTNTKTEETKQAEPAAGADNNKRLAWFETREAGLTEYLVKEGFITAEGAARDDFDPVETLRVLHAGKVPALVEKLDELEAITAERDQLKAALEKANGKLADAKRGEKQAKPRAIKPPKDPLTGAALIEAIGKAGSIELIASDGKQEITGVEPLVLQAGHFAETQAGIGLTIASFEVTGPPAGKAAFALAGWALLLDGKLVAYRDRGGTLQLGGGQKYNLAGDVIF